MTMNRRYAPGMFAVEIVCIDHESLDSRRARKHVGLQLFDTREAADKYAKECTNSGNTESYEGYVRRARPDDKEWA